MAQNKSDRRAGVVADVLFGSSGIVSIAAPTVAELGALTKIDASIVGALPAIPRTAAAVRVDGLSDTSTAETVGKQTNGPITMTCYRHFDGTDEVWALFDDTVFPKNTDHLVVCRAGFTGGTPTAGDLVEVYAVQIAAREPQGDGENDAQRFNVTLTRIDEDQDATVAA